MFVGLALVVLPALKLLAQAQEACKETATRKCSG